MEDTAGTLAGGLEEGRQTAPAQPDQPKRPRASNESTTRGADPYDVLHDVIMVRKVSKEAYGRNEVALFIFGRSKFPFDDKTFPKLTAALERFNSLPQTQIEGT